MTIGCVQKERERPSEREKQGPRPQPLITWFHPRNQETAKYGDFSCDTQTVPPSVACVADTVSRRKS